MRNRLTKTRKHSNQTPAFAIHSDDSPGPDSPVSAVSAPEAAQAAQDPDRSTPSKAPRPSHERPSARSTLALASGGTVNSAMSRASATNGGVHGKALPAVPGYMQQQIPTRMNSTIRTVTSFDDRHHRLSDDSATDWAPSQSTSRNSGFSSSVNSTASMSSTSQENTQTHNGVSKTSSPGSGVRLKPSPTSLQDAFLDVPKAPSARSSVEIPQRESSLGASPAAPPYANFSSIEPPPAGGGSQYQESPLGAPEAHLSNGGWDSTVGKAGLGKTGRVINRLVSENESLKRDIKVERLRAEESKQAARLIEDKLERIVSDCESRLLEANVTKALLARKERQVESLQSAVELEKKRTADAREREHMWKDEMEKVRTESQRQVEDATNYAALVEGRYNAISGHWRDQGDEVRKSMTKMKTEIISLLEERKQDDDRIGTLRDLCDQQDGNIRELQQQKENIAAQFDRYKAEQEEALKSIKTRAKEREEEQERMLKESKEVLEKLRWALNVRDKVEWAQ